MHTETNQRVPERLAGAAWVELCTADGACSDSFPLNDPSPGEGLRFLRDMRAQGSTISRRGNVVRITSPAAGLPLPKTLGRAP